MRRYALLAALGCSACTVFFGLVLVAGVAFDSSSAFSRSPSPYRRPHRSSSTKVARLLKGNNVRRWYVKDNINDNNRLASTTELFSAENGGDDGTCTGVWNPSVRRVLAAVSAVGALETGVLTVVKQVSPTGGVEALCKASGSSGCGNVLSSPLASVGGIPLTLFGFAAYCVVAFLAVYPLFASNDATTNSDGSQYDDSTNRLALVTLTTGMATFSAFLMSLLFFVLKESCPYCILSAILSMTLGTITWFSGAATQQNRKAAIAGLSSVVITTIATFGLVLNADVADAKLAASGKNTATAETVMMNQSPPPITETSSKRALALAKDLKALDARMFGAFWCSHCYDQKQTLGKEAMKMLTYIECDKEGLNNQRPLCQEKKIPGYPTWEIAGSLHPGEQSLEELEEIVKSVMDSKK